MMQTVQEIKMAIQSLSPDDFSDVKKWILELEWQDWDKQIEKDSEAGKLDFLMAEALTEKAQNKLREL
jgi:hypothetical protein